LYKAYFIFILFSFSLSDLNAQENLVLNPSFEDTTSTTSGYPFLITTNWWSPNGFDPDYFTPFCVELCCGSGAIHCAGEVGYLGYQLAQDSSSYLGMVIYETTGDTKEYGQGFLSEPMISGASYCVGIWIALADSSSFLSCDFQVAFTDVLILDGQASNFFLQDFVAFDISGINDTTWTYFEGTYIANGGEQYVYLGSNTPNESITCIQALEPTLIWNSCYILVDNVSVRESKLCVVSADQHQGRNHLIFFPNPIDEILTISGLGNNNSVINLFDGIGRLCLTHNSNISEVELNVSNLQRGIYFLQIEQEGIRYENKILKE